MLEIIWSVLDHIELLRTSVSIPSTSGQEAAVARFFVSQMATFADEALVDGAGNAVARLGTGPLRVYFLGHIDTVPGSVVVRLEEGKLYGRGAVDAKGAFCTAVAAASTLPADVLERLTLVLIGAVEEEVPTSRGARHALGVLPKPDLVIIGEPSGWAAMTLGYKGRLVVKPARVKTNFHSAGEGTTAPEDVVAVYSAVKAWADGLNEGVDSIFDAVQLSLQAFSSANDGLAQRAAATLGLRLPPRLSPEEAEAALRKLLAGPVGEGLELTFTGHERAYRSVKDTPLTRAFRAAIRKAGGTPRFKVKTGTSDMNVVAPVWNVPMLAYGPGDSSLDHTPDEHLLIDEYERAIEVLRAAFTELGRE